MARRSSQHALAEFSVASSMRVSRVRRRLSSTARSVQCAPVSRCRSRKASFAPPVRRTIPRDGSAAPIAGTTRHASSSTARRRGSWTASSASSSNGRDGRWRRGSDSLRVPDARGNGSASVTASARRASRDSRSRVARSSGRAARVPSGLRRASRACRVRGHPAKSSRASSRRQGANNWRHGVAAAGADVAEPVSLSPPANVRPSRNSRRRSNRDRNHLVRPGRNARRGKIARRGRTGRRARRARNSPQARRLKLPVPRQTSAAGSADGAGAVVAVAVATAELVAAAASRAVRNRTEHSANPSQRMQ